jgi:hypothetical protein
MTVHRCAVLYSCLCVVCVLACLLVGVFAIVDIAVGRFGCLCVFGTQGVSVMPPIWLL